MPAHALWPPRRFALLDILVILTVVVGLCYSIAALPTQNATSVNVFREGHLIARYPITVNRDAVVDGVTGKLVLRIQSGGNLRLVDCGCDFGLGKPEQRSTMRLMAASRRALVSSLATCGGFSQFS